MKDKKPKPTKPLLPKQELFCQLYLKGNRKQFGNATQCYIDAYNIDIHLYNENGTPDYEQNTKNYNTARATGSENLAKLHIKARINEILKATFTDSSVDDETAKIIAQDNDLGSKLGAIKEYNRLCERVKEKPPVALTYDLTGKTLKEIELIRQTLL